MSANIGNVDRGVRLILGAIVFAIALSGSVSLFETAGVKYAVAAAGLLLMLTATFRFCPLYRLFGFKTCSR